MQYINKIGTLQNRHSKAVFIANKSLEIKQIGQIVYSKAIYTAWNSF